VSTIKTKEKKWYLWKQWFSFSVGV